MENIKDGDIITLENGDIIKISLTKIGETVTNITPTRKYKLNIVVNLYTPYLIKVLTLQPIL